MTFQSILLCLLYCFQCSIARDESANKAPCQLEEATRATVCDPDSHYCYPQGKINGCDCWWEEHHPTYYSVPNGLHIRCDGVRYIRGEISTHTKSLTWYQATGHDLISILKSRELTALETLNIECTTKDMVFTAKDFNSGVPNLKFLTIFGRLWTLSRVEDYTFSPRFKANLVYLAILDGELTHMWKEDWKALQKLKDKPTFTVGDDKPRLICDCAAWKARLIVTQTKCLRPEDKTVVDINPSMKEPAKTKCSIGPLKKWFKGASSPTAD